MEFIAKMDNRIATKKEKLGQLNDDVLSIVGYFLISQMLKNEKKKDGHHRNQRWVVDWRIFCSALNGRKKN